MATRIKVKRILELLEKDLSANEIAKTYSISKHSNCEDLQHFQALNPCGTRKSLGAWHLLWKCQGAIGRGTL